VVDIVLENVQRGHPLDGLLHNQSLLRQGWQTPPTKLAEEFAGLLEQRQPMLHGGRHAMLDLTNRLIARPPGEPQLWICTRKPDGEWSDAMFMRRSERISPQQAANGQ